MGESVLLLVCSAIRNDGSKINSNDSETIVLEAKLRNTRLKGLKSETQKVRSIPIVDYSRVNVCKLIIVETTRLH